MTKNEAIASREKVDAREGTISPIHNDVTITDQARQVAVSRVDQVAQECGMTIAQLTLAAGLTLGSKSRKRIARLSK